MPSLRVVGADQAAMSPVRAREGVAETPGGGPRPAIVERIDDFRAATRAARRATHTVGLVPTMGALHEGHASLIRRAAAECSVVAVTVFVNPLQFGPQEDLAEYPRDLESDCRVAGRAGAHLVFAPTVAAMYPEPPATTVTVTGLSEALEGAARPGHFAGVATVVTKLLAISGPCTAYFGEKDFQQLAVVRRMVEDLSMPVAVVACPTVREPDGLAMSTRNTYLDPAERMAAPVLYRALVEGAAVIAAGERHATAVRARMIDVLTAEPLARLDYAEVVRAVDLQPLSALSGEVRLLVAARIGSTRLIDNLGVTV